jgi:hypothetical protein
MIRMVWKIIFGVVGMVLMFGIFGLVVDIGNHIFGVMPFMEFNTFPSPYHYSFMQFLSRLYDNLPSILFYGLLWYAVSYTLYRSFT